jgi:apolipoprotein N-acyltransferase
LRNLGVTDAIAMPGGFTAAPQRAMLTLPGGRSFYPLICYEAIFPDEIGDGVQRAGALLNVTNDGWFGHTPGPYQHFQQARIRAIENGTPLIRGANTGISAVVDPLGRIVRGLAYNQKGVMDATLGGGNVPYWNVQDRRYHFWLVISALFLIASVSRAGFNFRKN